MSRTEKMANTEKLVDFKDNVNELKKLVAPQAAPWNYRLKFRNICVLGVVHIAAIYGLYLSITSAKWETIGFTLFLGVISTLGVTAGVHRLWSHRSYEAKMPLQILLMLFNSIASQKIVINWVRDHRLHHRYCDTDADPHNATRGYFYAHIGWLLTYKHSEVVKHEKHVDLSDIYNNPVLMFQKKYAVPFIGLVGYLLPTLLPWYFWEETLSNSLCINLLRYATVLNGTFLINSSAHLSGNKPYDSRILPSQNMFVTIMTAGEGYHNYHHVFPWDYRASELGNSIFNLSTNFIDFFAMIGWAYDLKSVPQEVVKTRASRTGDGTDLWGWGDKKMTEAQKSKTEITNQKTV